jgi:glycosyltransferase involved in cell wall biosynthesis
VTRRGTGAVTRTIFMVGRMLDQEDGLGVYGYHLFQQLLALDPTTRYVIGLATPKHAAAFESRSNAEVVLLPQRPKLWWDQVVVPRAARRAGAHLLFNPKFSVPLFSRLPSVMVLRSSDWYVNPSNYPWWDNLYIRLALPAYCRKARRLLAVSATIRDDLARYARVDPAKVTVSYSAPAAYFAPMPREAARGQTARYGLPPDFIFSTARAYHTAFKSDVPYAGANLPTLVKAYRRYRNAGGTLPLVVAGRKLEDALAAQGLGPEDLAGIRFVGLVPHREMPALYALATCFVLTTLYESFSLPVVEAMASGCPVIGPATGAVPEIAGDAAMLVNPRDEAALERALATMTSREDVRRRCREAGLRRAADFSWSRTAERTLAVFDQLVPRC